MTHPSDLELPDELQDTPSNIDHGENGQESPDEILRTYEDLTLAELIGEMVRSPVRTWNILVEIVRSPKHDRPEAPGHTSNRDRSTFSDFFRRSDEDGVTMVSGRHRPATRPPIELNPAVLKACRIAMIQLAAQLAAFFIALNGSFILVNTPGRTVGTTLVRGAPFLIFGFILWIAADVYGDWDNLKLWWAQKRARFRKHDHAAPVDAAPAASVQTREVPQSKAFDWRDYHPVRVVASIGFLIFATITFFASGGNQFKLMGVMTWFVSIIMVVIAFVPVRDFELWFDTATFRLRSWRPRMTWALPVLVIIFILGANFRIKDLDQLPPEMTSDHVEKLLDAQRIFEGNPQIFFPNNGGREPIQMYLMALFTRVPGIHMDFNWLKALSVIEGLITLPLLFWMGREIMGAEDRKLATAIGVALMALVAVSYWHSMLSRLALRIVLTPLITALLMIYLSRAVRYNRRTDFVKTGLILGVGLYAYQAVRMLPVVITIGVALAFFFRTRGWQPRIEYLRNFVVLAVIAFVIFIPMFRFSVDEPDLFWMRATGRLLGDATVEEYDEQGNLTFQQVPFDQRIDALEENLSILKGNIAGVLLMFNWKGDVAWINGVPNSPEMDPFTGTLFILGLGAWIGLAVRRRDVIHWLMPAMLFIMLLPSALAIAFPLENPSATRASGAIPIAYFFAALPLALIARSFLRVMPRAMGYAVAGVFVVFTVGGAYVENTDLYFNKYPPFYLDASLPHSEGGAILRGFAESDGSYANAFMIGYLHWWDHRALGIAGGALGLIPGQVEWPNGIDPNVTTVPDFVNNARFRSGPYRLDPNRDLLFFLSVNDQLTRQAMQEWFPDGRELIIDSYQPGDDFVVYRVPWLGEQGFQEFADRFVGT